MKEEKTICLRIMSFILNTKIGITGGSGLIGKILIKILKKKKIKFTCYKKDIRDDKSIKEWLLKNKDIDKICHLAAIVPTNLVNKNRNKSIAVNLKGTIALYNAVKSLNKNIWFFFASTSHRKTHPALFHSTTD